MRSAAVDRRLEAIAGPPLAMLTTPNVASDPLDIGVTEARTMYVVASTTDAANVRQIANLGGPANGANAGEGLLIFRSQNIGIGGCSFRGAMIGGSIVTQSVRIGWPFGVPLAMCGWFDGARFGSVGYGEAPKLSNIQTGELNPAPRLRMATAEAGVLPIAALAYRGVHDSSTYTRVLAWLMQRYQVTPPPAG